MRKRKYLIGALAAASLLLAGCATGGDSASDGPVELTYWTWAASTADAVEVWNEANPDIQVTTVDMGRNNEQTAKLLAAVRAGEGPDLFQNEFQALPASVVDGIALDVSEYIGDVESEYTESVWNLVTMDGATYGIPIDLAPMMLFYRADLLEAAGASVPATWDEYRAMAETLAANTPGVTATIYPPNDMSQFTGFVQQAGGAWWTVEDGVWTVDVDSPESVQVADYWQSLGADGLVSVEPWWTPEWTQSMIGGQVATFPAGAWFASTLGNNVPEEDRHLWRAAPLPRWSEADPVGFMGGSAASVAVTSKHPEQAAEFLRWIATSEEATAALTGRGVPPATIAGADSLEGWAPNGIGEGQDDFMQLIGEASRSTATVTWGPNANVALTSYQDEMGKAVEGGTSWADALAIVQRKTLDDLVSAGFTAD